MSEIDTSDFTYLQAATAAGMSPGLFSMFLQERGFVGRKSPHHRNGKLIGVSELEALVGYKLTAAQIESARKAKAPRTLKQNDERRRKRFPTMDNEMNFDMGWVRFGFEFANDKWQRLLLAHGINNIAAPPFEPEMATALASRNLFTRAEMYELLESCVKQRNRQWDEWVNDSVQRAQFPAGPTTLDFKYPDPEEDNHD